MVEFRTHSANSYFVLCMAKCTAVFEQWREWYNGDENTPWSIKNFCPYVC